MTPTKASSTYANVHCMKTLATVVEFAYQKELLLVRCQKSKKEKIDNLSL